MLHGMLFFALLSLSGVAQAEVDWSDVREYLSKNKIEKSIEEISDVDVEDLSKEDNQLKPFALGWLHFKQKRYDKARPYLTESLKQSNQLLGYSHYLLGVIFYETKNSLKAEFHLNQAIKLEVSRKHKYQSRYLLGLLAMDKKHWRTAYKHMRYVEKKWRGDINHAESVWNLARIEIGRARPWRLCRWAQKLFTKYPDYIKVADWGMNLKTNKIDKYPTQCLYTLDQQKRRVKRLVWSGMADEAQREIDLWVKENPQVSAFYKDSLHSTYLLRTGYPKKSKQLLEKHFQQQGKNYQFLIQYARVSSKVGNYDLAMSSYMKAYELLPRSRRGRTALFQAAFYAYQNQDYDLAINLLGTIAKKHKRSGLARDARWYLAWVKYLKKDFNGAISEFKYIKKRKRGNRWERRRWRRIPSEKVNYWLARSYIKVNEFDSAAELLDKINNKSYMSYYSLASQQRLKNIEPKLSIAYKQKRLQLERSVASEEEKKNEEEVSKAPLITSIEEQEKFNDSLREEEDDTESFFLGILQDREDQELEADEVEELFADSKNQKLKNRFVRVKKLILMGFFDLAKWELYEIERRTKNKDQLKALMGAYRGIKAYNRSSYISHTYFSTQRIRNKITGVTYLWEYAYPRAYGSSVDSFSEKFNVDPYFTWSIMRAESRYRAEIQSPVGAKGLMQLMPYTGLQVANILGEGEQFNASMLLLPKVNIKLGTRYLSRLLKVFEGQTALAAAAYNAGPHRVQTWAWQFGDLDFDEFIEHIPYKETRNYVKKVTKNLAIYKSIYEKDVTAGAFLANTVNTKNIAEFSNRENWGSL